MSLAYRIYRGAEIAAIVPDLARLRITVFRDWPYLYEGDLTYETGYLARYAQSGAIVVAAYDGAQMVGAATGMPLLQHDDDFSGALAACDIAAEDVFYCAESVLMQDHRGQGAGHMFFDAREAEARTQRKTYSAFCAVVRPADHPMAPKDYRPLNEFWKKRGYQKLDGVFAEFSWLDIGDSEKTQKRLQFWIKQL
ncbi:GNAT family N-acetyltransferase [Roseobacter sp. HKCCA2468]|jgi:GNAT superfamily N-acetyltransferase|uniref:GNAT family N-acetyltransferase n=1 Tax=Roseobacter sp. HKCCA2468 TaxID=3120342 RepID=UPI0030EF05E9|nr:GNAT family N-acetyltransferase [Rhodobacterales bacterium FZCC0069]MBF9026650.1 GNAT family N-acetyltransferase [Rhodobacterales bacterium FZCC0188]